MPSALAYTTKQDTATKASGAILLIKLALPSTTETCPTFAWRSMVPVSGWSWSRTAQRAAAERPAPPVLDQDQTPEKTAFQAIGRPSLNPISKGGQLPKKPAHPRESGDPSFRCTGQRGYRAN